MRDRNVGNFLPEGQPQLHLQILNRPPEAWVFEKANGVVQIENIKIGGGQDYGTRDCTDKCHAHARAK